MVVAEDRPVRGIEVVEEFQSARIGDPATRHAVACRVVGVADADVQTPAGPYAVGGG
jgi:hypothetical protein